MLKMTKCSSKGMEPLSPAPTLSFFFFSSGAAWKVFKTLRFSPFALVQEHTTWRWIYNEGAKSAVLPIMIEEDYQHTERREAAQIISFFPASEASSKLPQVSQIVSIGKLSLQSSVALLISPTEMSVVPCCQSICAHGGIEKPIICYYLSRACNGV